MGIKQTLHCALQKFERDNVSSWGGCRNQFVPGNLVIGSHHRGAWSTIAIQDSRKPVGTVQGTSRAGGSYSYYFS